MNAGPFVACVEILSPVGGSFSLDGWVVDVAHDCTAPAASFAGVWGGTYQCSNNCTGQPFGGSITVTVTQAADGTASSTDDDGQTYAGTVCGSEFRFVSNEELETERGRMTLTGASTAEKRSTWRYSLAPYCGGDCIDTLTRR
jgi:hypothetical protein